MLIVGPLALMGCQESIGSVEPPLLLPPPDGFIVPCQRPIKLPERSLTQSETEFFWATDRSNLVTCADRYSAVVSFYSDRDSRISKNDR